MIIFAYYLSNTMEQKKNTPDKNAPQRPRPRRQRLRLPFDNRKQDFAGWIYDNRIGLCVTTIVYLLLAIAFVVSKIGGTTRVAPDTIYIDLGELELLEEKRDKLLEEIKRKNNNIDWNAIRNLSSNENATNEKLEDEKGMNTSELNNSANDVQNDMKANREAYERGLREADAISQNRPGKEGNSDKSKDINRKGRVMVEYDFKDPVRHKRNLITPGYRCEGGGEVIVSATLDQGGNVKSAKVISGGDECMRQTALSAARGSKFDINSSAPTEHVGTITYIFIPQ
jgi:hypothetical protein